MIYETYFLILRSTVLKMNSIRSLPSSSLSDLFKRLWVAPRVKSSRTRRSSLQQRGFETERHISAFQFTRELIPCIGEASEDLQEQWTLFLPASKKKFVLLSLSNEVLIANKCSSIPIPAAKLRFSQHLFCPDVIYDVSAVGQSRWNECQEAAFNHLFPLNISDVKSEQQVDDSFR